MQPVCLLAITTSHIAPKIKVWLGLGSPTVFFKTTFRVSHLFTFVIISIVLQVLEKARQANHHALFSHPITQNRYQTIPKYTQHSAREIVSDVLRSVAAKKKRYGPRTSRGLFRPPPSCTWCGTAVHSLPPSPPPRPSEFPPSLLRLETMRVRLSSSARPPQDLVLSSSRLSRGARDRDLASHSKKYDSSKP